MLVGIRPTDSALENTSGVVYHPQDEGGGGNIAFYEIVNTGDEIKIDLGDYMNTLDNPAAIFNTVFGTTDYDILDQTTGNAIVSEQSGFDTDVWAVDLSGTSGQYTITNFDTADGVDGTQAAWYPYVTLASVE